MFSEVFAKFLIFFSDILDRYLNENDKKKIIVHYYLVVNNLNFRSNYYKEYILIRLNKFEITFNKIILLCKVHCLYFYLNTLL